MNTESTADRGAQAPESSLADHAPRPALYYGLALIVAGVGLVVRLLLDTDHTDFVSEYFSAWTIHGLVLFPVSAWLATVVVRPLFRRLPSAWAPRMLLRVALVVLHYLFIFLAAVALFSFLEGKLHEGSRWGGTGAWLTFMPFLAPHEFVVFALLFVLAHVIPGRITRLLPARSFKPSWWVAPAVVTLGAITAANSLSFKSANVIKNELLAQFVRTGHILAMTDDAHIGEAVTRLESEYGLPATGKPSVRLVERLEKEPTKLVYTVGAPDADAAELSRVCSHISGHEWTTIREKLGLPDTEVMAFEIRLAEGAKAGSGCSLAGFHRQSVSISPVNGAPVAMLAMEQPAYFSSDNEKATLTVSQVHFSVETSTATVSLDGQVSMLRNTIEAPAKPAGFQLLVSNKRPSPSGIQENRFINTIVSVNGNAAISDNQFSGPSAHLHVSEGAPTLGTNHFKDTAGNLILVTGTGQPKISGKIYLSSASRWPLIAARDQARVDFSDGSVAAPLAAGCLSASGAAKLNISRVHIGPCGPNYWPVYLDEQATAEIRHARFDPAAGDLRAQFNKPLEDSVLLLENSQVDEQAAQ